MNNNAVVSYNSAMDFVLERRGGWLFSITICLLLFVLTGKSYDLSEEKPRYAAFEQNLKFIVQHNNEAANGKQSYRMGINKYSDMVWIG